MTQTAADTAPVHRWRFFRAGGFDQLRLDSAADLRGLLSLDQKLWLALACPTGSVEFDRRTLALIDRDGDGRIRAPELLAAVDWTLRMLTDAEACFAGHDALPLTLIDASHPEGRGCWPRRNASSPISANPTARRSRPKRPPTCSACLPPPA